MQEQTQAGGPLKRINFETGRFQANGTWYQIESSLSIERYCELQILEKEMGFGVTFRTIFDRLKTIYVELNKVNFVGAAVMLDTLLKGISKLEEREPVAFKICALFINYDGENRAAWNNDLVVKKMNDWKLEGLDSQDFFIVAVNSISGFTEIYNKVTQAISENSLQILMEEDAPKN